MNVELTKTGTFGRVLVWAISVRPSEFNRTGAGQTSHEAADWLLVQESNNRGASPALGPRSSFPQEIRLMSTARGSKPETDIADGADRSIAD